MDNQTRKGLQSLMKEPAWDAMEAYFTNFMETRFPTQSIRRDTGFNTIWDAAFSEGGKHYVEDFFNGLENEASRI